MLKTGVKKIVEKIQNNVWKVEVKNETNSDHLPHLAYYFPCTKTKNIGVLTFIHTCLNARRKRSMHRYKSLISRFYDKVFSSKFQRKISESLFIKDYRPESTLDTRMIRYPTLDMMMFHETFGQEF